MRFLAAYTYFAILTGLALAFPSAGRSRTIIPVAYNPSTSPPNFNPPRPVVSRALDTQVTCNILVKDGNTSLGYISPVWNEYGEYGTLQPSASGALEIQFTYNSSSSSHIEIAVTNCPDKTSPLFGAVMGFSTDNDNFGDDSYNYAYLAGTSHVQAGPAAVGINSFTTTTTYDGDIESSIWEYDTDTHELSPQWVNSDASTPKTYLVYANDANALILTGGLATFRDTFGPYPEVTFTCVPLET